VSRRGNTLRREASALLRGVAAKLKSPELSILATSVELDAFTRVKKAIDDMIAQLKAQQADEVKKHDWCNFELHENEVATMKTEDKKADLTAKVEDLGSTLSRITDEIAKAKSDIAQMQLDLQRASENRKKENMDFQSTVADQRATQAVLKTALERLAKFYDEEALVQQKKTGQTPPVPQAEYSKSSGATGVMSMIEKLIYDAREVEADSRKSEIQAQAQYESLVAETFSSIRALQSQVLSKTQAKAQAAKDKSETEGDLADTKTELEELGKYDGELHSDCDYLIKNFAVRQEARGQEVTALQQAKQILSGAMSN
jgi:peptidoglycan hydrolase CwlO-like protein